MAKKSLFDEVMSFKHLVAKPLVSLVFFVILSMGVNWFLVSITGFGVFAQIAAAVEAIVAFIILSIGLKLHEGREFFFASLASFLLIAFWAAILAAFGVPYLTLDLGSTTGYLGLTTKMAVTFGQLFLAEVIGMRVLEPVL